MTDQWGPNDDAQPPTQPPAAPPTEPTLTLESEQAVGRSGVSGGRVVAGILGVLVLLGGAVFAVTQLGSSGPSSAEGAVRELLDAASDEDVLGLLAALDPGERDALRGPVEDLFGELQRLEVFSDDFRLDGVPGIDLEFSDVELREEPVRDDLVRVYFTGGTVTAGIDGREVPLGAFVDDALERFDVDRSGLDELQESTTGEIPDDGTFLVAHEGSDGWRVSIGYTAAEYARLGAGLPLPDEGIEPVGAESPEAAVEGMLESIAGFDLTGVIARLSPGELGPLQDYAPLFLGEAQRALDRATGDVEVSIDGVDLRSETDGDRGQVFVDGFAISVVVDGDEAALAVEDGCFRISGSLVDDLFDDAFGEAPFDTDEPICPEDFEAASEDLLGELEAEGFPTDELSMPTLPTLDVGDVGISTVRIDGEWYVAPFATVLDSMVTGLEAVEREHLEGFFSFVESFASGFMLDQSFTVEDFEDFEEFEEFGSPTTTWLDSTDATVPPYDPTQLDELLEVVAGGDAEVAACIEDALPRLGDEFTAYELADAWEFGYEPSRATQQVLDDALAECTPGTS